MMNYWYKNCKNVGKEIVKIVQKEILFFIIGPSVYHVKHFLLKFLSIKWPVGDYLESLLTFMMSLVPEKVWITKRNETMN